MKELMLTLLTLGPCCAYAQSTNDFVSVTNDWHSASFTNVYQLAQARLAANSNDVVAAYIMFDWNVCFADLADVSNSVMRVIELSDSVTNEVFRTPYMQLRNEFIYYRDVFLPTVSEATRQAERYKSYLQGKDMPSVYMLNLLDKASLW